jgi:hypothetical protein
MTSNRTRRVVAPSTSDWTSWLQQFMDDTLFWRQRILHVFGEGQISSRSCGLWWLGSGVERFIGVVEDADPSRGECQQQRVVKLLELVQIQSIPPKRCVPAAPCRCCSLRNVAWKSMGTVRDGHVSCPQLQRLLSEVL